MAAAQNVPCHELECVHILHDAENCCIPQTCTLTGAEVASRVLDEISRLLGGVDLTNARIDWKMVLRWKAKNKFHCPKTIMNELFELNDGSGRFKRMHFQHMSCSGRPGSVDDVIKSEMDMLSSQFSKWNATTLSRRAVVLLSGDKDFVAFLRKLKHPSSGGPGVLVAMLHTGKANKAVTDALQVPELRAAFPMHSGQWTHLLKGSFPQAAAAAGLPHACSATAHAAALPQDARLSSTHAACAETLVHQEEEIERFEDGDTAQLRWDAPRDAGLRWNDTEAELTFDEACRKLENDINEHVLCLHCPFCDMVIFPDWDRCDALKCDACMQWFCGLCLSVSSDGDAEKAHDCAHDCRLKHPAPQPGEPDPAHVEVMQRALHRTLQRYDDAVCCAVLQLPRVRDSLVGVPLQIPPEYMCSDALVEDGDHDGPAPPPAPETESKDPTLHLSNAAQATTSDDGAAAALHESTRAAAAGSGSVLSSREALLQPATAPPEASAETTAVSHSDTNGTHPGAGGKDREASADALPCSTAEGSSVQVVPFTEQDQERAEAEGLYSEGGDTDGDNGTLSDDNSSAVGSDSGSHGIEARSALDDHDSQVGDDEGKDGCDTDGSATEDDAWEDADEGSLSEVADGAVDGRPLHHSSGDGATWPAAAGAGGAAGGACKGHLEAAGGGGTNVASAQGPAQPLVPSGSGPESQGSAGLSAGGVARVSSSGSHGSEAWV